MDNFTHLLNTFNFIATMVPFIITFLFIGVMLAIAISFSYPVSGWLDERGHWKTLLVALVGFILGLFAFTHGYGVLWPVENDAMIVFPPDGATSSLAWILLLFGWVCSPVSAAAGFYSGWHAYRDLRYLI